MSDLNERLDHAFRTIEPGPAPVEAAMDHGKKIRNRRRVAAIAGSVAVIAGAAACVPALAHHQALPSPTNSHVRVTVNPPGPHSPAGTIASGLIGTKAWYLRLESPGTKNCVVAGNDAGNFACDTLSQADASADPISLEGMSGGNGGNQYFVSFGVVRKDVTSVRVVLADGTVLAPRPTTVHGMRLVAFATPLSRRADSVVSLTVYSRTGEIATSIPFNGPSGDSGPSFGAWLRPGQAGAARFTETIGSGTADGHAWAMTAYIGPWGICIRGDGGGSCQASATKVQGGTGELGSMGNQSSGALVWGHAADSVSYLIVTPKGGAAMRVGVTAVGKQKYFAFALSHWPQKGDRWTAYDAAGKSVASGPVS